MYQKYLEV